MIKNQIKMLGSVIMGWMCITIGVMTYIVYQNQNNIIIGPNQDIYIFGIFINAFITYSIFVTYFF